MTSIIEEANRITLADTLNTAIHVLAWTRDRLLLGAPMDASTRSDLDEVVRLVTSVKLY